MLEQTHLIECAICGEEHDEEETYTLVNGEPVCESCYEDGEAICCEECEELHYSEDVEHIDDEFICADCIDNVTDVCMSCDERHLSDIMIFDSYGNALCDNCYYDDYARCEECGEFVHIDNIINRNDYIYCPHCAPSNGYVRDYHDYNDLPTRFFGESEHNEFFGVELEVEYNNDYESSDHDYTAEQIHNRIENDELYYMRDGSLRDGFEIISQPCTLDYHMNKLNWKGVLNEARDQDYISHNAGTAGLHIHVSRKAFGNDLNERNMNIAKLLFVVERHWSEIVRFSRRTIDQLDDWAKSYAYEYNINRDNLDAMELFNTANGAGKYFAVNLSKVHTVELRLFRGTLKYNSFIATIQFVKLLKDLVIEYSIEELQTMTWNDIAVYLQKAGYEELNTYLKERNLNVPEQLSSTQDTNKELITKRKIVALF